MVDVEHGNDDGNALDAFFLYIALLCCMKDLFTGYFWQESASMGFAEVGRCSCCMVCGVFSCLWQQLPVAAGTTENAVKDLLVGFGPKGSTFDPHWKRTAEFPKLMYSSKAQSSSRN